jgi:hypothetical protein
MSQRPWIPLLVVGACFLASRAAFGQPGNSSHRFIDPPADSPLDEEGLSARVRDFSEQRDVDALVQALKDHPRLLNLKPKELEQLRQQVSKDPRFQDPKFREQVKKAVANGHLSDEQKETLKKAATTPPADSGADSDPNKPGGPNKLTPNPDQPIEADKDSLERQRSANQRGSRTGDADWLNQQAAKRLNSFARMIDRTGGRNSDRLRNTLRQLTSRNLSDRNFLNWQDPTGLNLGNNLGRLGKYLSGARSGSGTAERLSRLPSTPNLGTPSGVGGSWSAPSFGNSASAGAGGILLWLLIVALILVILWQVSARMQAAGRRARAGWQLGPWPVDPRRVASRGELVQAFEHLAYLFLGPQARHCHHVDLAERLGAAHATPAGRAAAAGLGHLYEQARYAPPEEPMPEADLVAARRDLSLLAEGSA